MWAMSWRRCCPTRERTHGAMTRSEEQAARLTFGMLTFLVWG
jgi:hypothetical protein